MSITSYEKRLFLAVAALFVISVIGHFTHPLTPGSIKALVASLGLHSNLGGNHFVDTRTWLGIPNAADVLSNLPFALFGIYGFFLQAKLRNPSQRFVNRESFVLTLFFIGLIFTTIGSSLYHLAPSDSTLLWDRSGMAFAFAGVLGIAASERVSVRSGIWLGLASLAAGVLSLAVWSQTGDVLGWGVFQFGGMALVLVLAFTARIPKSLGVSLFALIAYYAIAKVCEANDHLLYEATGHLVSGHTLKHLVASLAAWPVIRALR
jgi:hypothetical protein